MDSIQDNKSPLLVVLSGPSGVGKDAVIVRMQELGEPFHFVITATTRPRRETELDGVDYMFHSSKTFLDMVANNEMLEWAEVYGNYYGVPKLQVIRALNEGKDVFIKTDVQGAATIREIAPDAVSIFLQPSEISDLSQRLVRRHSESANALAIRLHTAQREMSEAAKFDHVVTNKQGELNETVSEIQEILADERLREPPRCVRL